MRITKNLDGMERAMRIILGIVLLMLVSFRFVGPQTSWAYLGFIGLIPLITGSIGY
jgi:fructose-specific phosphotransferase system IIC component